MLITPGDDGLTEYGQRYSPITKTKSQRTNKEARPEAKVALLEEIKDNFRIYFPTKETVLASKGGLSVSPNDITLNGSVDDHRMEGQSAFSRSGTTLQLFLEISCEIARANVQACLCTTRQVGEADR